MSSVSTDVTFRKAHRAACGAGKCFPLTFHLKQTVRAAAMATTDMLGAWKQFSKQKLMFRHSNKQNVRDDGSPAYKYVRLLAEGQKH